MIYEICKRFPEDERFVLSPQMKRAAISIASNIAEGAGRNSNKDFAKYLSISLGSCYELGTQLVIANELKYLLDNEFELIEEKLGAIEKMIYKLQDYLKLKD